MLPLKKTAETETVTKATHVESEIGRIGCTVMDELASSLKPKEYVYSIAAEELVCRTTAVSSYRGAVGLLNRVLHRSDGKSFRTSTVAEHMESQGRKIGEYQHNKAREVLGEIPGMSETGIAETSDGNPDAARNPAPESGQDTQDKSEVFKDVIDRYNEGKEDWDKIKDRRLINDTETDPDDCVYISIDDVGVNHQKDTRKNGGTKDGEIVENTVIHVQSKEGVYIITDVGMKNAFTLLMAYLFLNDMFKNRLLYFFSDGARNIKTSIEEFFKPLCPYKHMLDWYHVEKRMTELLSMALKGSKDERHDIRYTLDRKLWTGNFDDAKAYLLSLEDKYVKNRKKLEEATVYLDRKKEYAACYALRKELGYRNSSNPAEKANDLVVANRQKHNGMSWSYDGSGALATITAISHNNEIGAWIEHGVITFTPRPVTESMAA